MHKYKQRFVSCIFTIIFLFWVVSHLGATKEVVEEALTCTVRFDANYGISPVHEKDVKVGERYGNLPYPERMGYKFLGWYQKKTQVNQAARVYLNQNHTLTAKWLGTPSLKYVKEEDFIRIQISRIGDATGVYLYVNGKRYDSADKSSGNADLKWKISKTKDGYVYSINMPAEEQFSCYARAYYKHNRKIVRGAKSETVSFDNRTSTYKLLDEKINLLDFAISMENYYLAGKSIFNRLGSSGLTPQGICYAEEYILITGYGPKAAKIVVLDRESMKGIAVLSLREEMLELDLGNEELLSHIGGIAYDQTKQEVWVSGVSKKTLIKIKKSTIDKYVKAATERDNTFLLEEREDFSIYNTLYKNAEGEYAYATPSFLEFENGELYIGTFSKDDVGYLRRFKGYKTSALELLEEMRIPNKIQGAVFTETGELILSQSYGRNNESRLYVYEGIEKNLSSYRLRQIVTGIPPMSEELVIQNDMLYILFESSAKRYRNDCKDVQETIWAVNVEEIVKKEETLEELEVTEEESTVENERGQKNDIP